jgi:hypothetical protein
VNDQQKLNANVPHEAAEIIDRIVAGMRMDGMRGGEVGALLIAINTVKAALQPPKPENTAQTHG